MARILIKRIYDAPDQSDGVRVLVDRLWPRGVTKKAAALDFWMKELAPSTELRKWFSHDPAKWKQFQQRYRKELEKQKESVALLCRKSRQGTLTLVYAARDEEHNAALALKAVLERKEHA